MSKQSQPSGIGYLIATVVPSIGRGATGFSPAYANIPNSTVTGFPFRTKYMAPPLSLTIMNLATLGGAAGYPYQSRLGGVPLTVNGYEVS